MKNLFKNHATGCVAHCSAFCHALRSWGIALSFASSIMFILLSCKDQVHLIQERAVAITLADEDLGAPRTQLFKQQISRQAEAADRLRELWLLHVGWQPTGFHVDSNSIITVHVRKISGTDLPKLMLGTSYSAEREYETFFQLKEGTNVINTETDLEIFYFGGQGPERWGGNVYIDYTSDSPGALGESEITFVSGFKKIPYYVQGTTSIADYQRMLDVFGDSVRQAMLVSDRTMLTVTVANARQYRSSNVDSLLLICDQVIESAEAISGLDRSSPEHYPRTTRILITDKPEGNPTAGFFISFPQVSMNEILTPSLLKNSWGLYHEIGHIYQQAWTWMAVSEVTVNVFSQAAQRAMGTPNGISDERWLKVNDYFARAASDRNYNTGPLDDLEKIVMFYQLWLAYGDIFYQNLHKKCRIDKPILNTDDEKMTYFMTTACDIAGEDLTDFFRKWGVPAPEATYAAIANKNLPQPSRDYTTAR